MTEMKKLFSKITGSDKDYFNLEDFQDVYSSKPEMVSWFDYFKEDDGGDLVNLVENVDSILKNLNTFFKRMGEVLESACLSRKRG